jgi:hypothetical protein
MTIACKVGVHGVHPDSMSRAPRREPCTICTAVAPDPVRTVRTYATGADDEPCLVHRLSRLHE